MNLKQKFKLKPLKINSFSSLQLAFTSDFEEGLLKSGAQILLNPWSSADYAVISVSDSRSSFTVSRSPFLILRSSFSVHNFPFLVLRSPFLVPRSPFYVLRSPFSVPRSPFPALSLPFPVPRSSIIVARSSFLVGVTSYYCYGTIVVGSNSDFLNIIVPWALF